MCAPIPNDVLVMMQNWISTAVANREAFTAYDVYEDLLEEMRRGMIHELPSQRVLSENLRHLFNTNNFVFKNENYCTTIVTNSDDSTGAVVYAPLSRVGRHYVRKVQRAVAGTTNKYRARLMSQ